MKEVLQIEESYKGRRMRTPSTKCRPNRKEQNREKKKKVKNPFSINPIKDKWGEIICLSKPFQRMKLR